jgi:hypothetical protein
LSDIFPVLKKIAPGLCGHQKMMESFSELKNFFRVSSTIIYYRKYVTKVK